MEALYTKRRNEITTNSTVSYSRDVCCDGQHLLNVPDAEHPLVYYRIEIGGTNQVTCSYCDKTFIYIEAEL